MTTSIRSHKSAIAPVTVEASASSTPVPPSAAESPQAPALIFLPPPPADAKIPAVPQGAAAPNGANYRTVTPKLTELAALAGALDDLRRFTNFALVFGVTGLPYAQVLQAFTVGNQWTTMRKASAAWDAFAQTQEGISWGTIRSMMDRMGPIFEIAAAADASLAVTFPSLAALLRAKKNIARKAVASRRANREALAKGEPPIYGAVGKRRKKADEKAIVAAAKSTPSAPATEVAVKVPAETGTATTVAPQAPGVATPVVSASTNGAAN